MISKLFTKTLLRMEAALNIRSRRHEVITANIANQDTPFYKAKELDFRNALHAASRGTKSIRLASTHSAHLAPRTTGGSPLSEQIRLSKSDRTARLDGNTVNSEKEMVRLTENTLMYQTTAQLISGKFRGLKNVIKEGR